MDCWTPGHRRLSCHGSPSTVKWKRPVVSLVQGIKDCRACCNQTRHSSSPQAKHPQCSRPNLGCKKMGHLATGMKPKTKKASWLLGFFFSCLLNHVKNGQAETSSLDGRAVGWGKVVGDIKKPPNSKTKPKSITRYKYSYLVSSCLPSVFRLVNHLPRQQHKMILERFLSNANHVMGPFALSLLCKEQSFTFHPKTANRYKKHPSLL